MLTNIHSFLEGGNQLTVAVWMIGAMFVGKFGAAWLAGKIYRYNRDQIMSMFGLSIGHAAAALAIVLVGFEAGLFNEGLVNAVVIMILVVGVISPQIVEIYGKRISLQRVLHAILRKQTPAYWFLFDTIRLQATFNGSGPDDTGEKIQ